MNNAEKAPRRRRSKSKKQRYLEKQEKREKQGCALWVVILLLGALAWWHWGTGKSQDTPAETTPANAEQEIPLSDLSPKELALRFISSSDTEMRLKMVRHPDKICEHLHLYSKQALSEKGHELRRLGKTRGKQRQHSFAVSFTDGTLRLLNVLETDEGYKIDWDSYARHCSASWEQLTTQASDQPELIRVFVRPGDYYVGDYIDRSQWRCFRLESPDTPITLFAFAKAGEMTTTLMQQAVLRSKNYRQHMILKVLPKGPFADDAFFEIEELVTLGWVMPEGQ